MLTLLTLLTLSACGFPRAADDYLNKLSALATKIETLSEQSTICQSDVDHIEQRYGYLAPGKNTSLEFDFTEQEAKQFQRLIEKIEKANADIIRKGDRTC